MSSPPKILRVMVVDDHPVVREGLRAMLCSDPEIQVVGEASDGSEAVELVEQLQPDVVLTDIRMPGMNGIEATQRIKEKRPSTVVIVLTMYDNEIYVIQALRAGAAGYLVKDSSRELLCHTIKVVMDGATIVRSGLLRQAIHGLLQAPHVSDQRQADSPAREHLTARELDVLRMMAEGYANKEIAGQLSLAEVTVKKHVQSIIGKLGASDRTHAAITAVRLGLVQ